MAHCARIDIIMYAAFARHGFSYKSLISKIGWRLRAEILHLVSSSHLPLCSQKRRGGRSHGKPESLDYLNASFRKVFQWRTIQILQYGLSEMRRLVFSIFKEVDNEWNIHRNEC